MGFKDNAIGAFKHFSDLGNYPSILREGWTNIVSPAEKLVNGYRSGNFLSELKNNALDFPFNTLLGGAGVLAASQYDQPDLDSSGPFESTFRRMGKILPSIGFMASSPFHRFGIPGTIAGLLGVSMVGDPIARYAGKAVDTISGMSPTLDEKAQKFNERIENEISALEATSPGMPRGQLTQSAVQKFLTENPGYDMSWAQGING